MVTRLDPVASRLAAADDVNTALVLDWLEARQQRDSLHRRAFWCSLGAWLLVTAAAVISSAVAIKFAHDTREAFSEVYPLSWNRRDQVFSPPLTLDIVPPVLALIAIVLLIGGLLGWWLGRFPGHRWTCSAIDWWNVSDAVSRLLAVGCTYPEAFDTAAEVARTSGNRWRLRQAAEHVRQGVSEPLLGPASDGDVAMVQTWVETIDVDPSERWRLANQHFAEVARRRVGVLQATVPIVSTLLAGLLIWMSISATLGWMWMTVGRMMVGGN